MSETATVLRAALVAPCFGCGEVRPLQREWLTEEDWVTKQPYEYRVWVCAGCKGRV